MSAIAAASAFATVNALSLLDASTRPVAGSYAAASTPAPGEVRVTLRSADGAAEIEVADTGIGISAEDLLRVFERFYRADKARSRESGGAGLGLSIARWIVDRHGGRITIESDVGRGCRVLVRLPSGLVGRSGSQPGR